MVLVLAPVAILAALGRIDRRLFTALWAVTLAFAVANASPVQLLWLFSPDATVAAMTSVRAHPDVTLTVRAVLAVAWQIAGWWAAVSCLRSRGEAVGVFFSQSGSHGWRAWAGVRPAGRALARLLGRGRCAAPAPGGQVYPTSSLQRGLLLVHGGLELSGEGVGFGVPVLKRGARAVFAGDAELVSDQPGPAR